VEGKKLIIEDTGVGMSKEEMINNLGRIAQSGTKQFQEMIKAKGTKTLDSDEQSTLIGQFGVGFYSGFLVADKMTVYSKGLNDPEGKTHMWQSEAGSSYTIAEVDGDDAIEAGSGTRLELSLREDAEDYLEDLKIKSLVQRYSEFVSFPIKVWTKKTTYEQVKDDEAPEPEEGEAKKMKTVPVTSQEY